MVKSYQRYEQDKCFGVISSNSNVLYVPSKSGQAITAGLEEILIWDIKTGELVKRLRDGVAPGAADAASSVLPLEVLVLEYHEPSGILAAGYQDGSIKIWDLASESVIINFTGHKSAITLLQFDSNGTRLCSGSKDASVILWDLVGETGLFKLKSHKDQITGIYFTSTLDKLEDELEDWLITTSKDGLIKLWDLQTKQCIESHIADAGECWALGVEGNLCITSGLDNQLKFWKLDLEDPKTKLKEAGVLEKLSKSRGIELSFKRFNSGLFFYIQNSDRTIEIFRIRSQEEISKATTKREKRLREKGMEEDEVKLSIESSYINLLVASFTTVRCSSKVRSCTWTKNLELLVSLNNNSLEYYTLQMPENIKKSQDVPSVKKFGIELPGHRNDVRSLDISDDNKLLASASNGLLKIFNIRTGNCIRTFECGYALCCQFLPGAALVVLGTRAGDIELYDLASSSLLDVVEGAHNGAVWSLDLTPDGKSLVTGSADKSVKFWDFKLENETVPGTERVVSRLKLFHSKTLELNDDILSVRISPDAKLLAVSLLDNTVKVFFMDTLRFFLSLYGHKLPVLSIDISFDSKLIITSSADKNIKIWGLEFGDCHKSIFGHQDSIMGVRFISNTHNFFSCSKDGLVKYWDGDKFESVQKLALHQSEVWAIAVSRDGQVMVSSSHDHSLRVWKETDDEVFLEEEREKEMDEQYESTLLASLEGDGDDLPRAAKDGEDEDVGDEVTRVSKQTTETLKSGEKLMEALDLATKEIEDREKYEIEKRTSPSTAIEPTRAPILVAMNQTPVEHVLSVVLKIKPSHLEDALMVLPFSYSLKLLKFVEIWTNAENMSANVVNLTTFSKILFFIMKTNYRELISQKDDKLKQQIINIKSQLRNELQKNCDTLGFNLNGLKFAKQQYDLNHNMEFIDENEQRLHQEKYARKRVYETVV